MRRNSTKIIYEPEDDVLNIWLSKKQIDYGEDEDGVITHYTKNGEPVYIEMLFASRFFKGMKKQSKSSKQKVSTSPAVLHKVKK